MIRRKLFAYTVIFTAGISAGFFIFERARIAGGALIMVISAAIICCFDTESGFEELLSAAMPRVDARRGRTQKKAAHCSYIVVLTHEKKILLAMLAAGFILFTYRYLWYGTGLHPGNSEVQVDGGQNIVAEDEDSDQDTDSINSIEGTVRSVTYKDDRMKIELFDTDCVRKGIRVLVSLKDNEYSEPAEIIGRRIRAYGILREPSGADNPGCFDYRIYLRSRKTGYLFTARYIESCEDSISLYGRYIRLLYLAREGFLDRFSDPDIRAFVKGTVFGDKSDISEEVLEDFSENGTGHILAVSGLHTGFLYSLLVFITRRRKSFDSAAFIIAVLLVYGDMTMWSPSTMRAVTVLSVSIMSIYVKRPFDLLSSVSAAAILILVLEPYQLFSTGFQMSFLALLAIAFLSGPLTHLTGEALAVMLSVQAGILPVTAFVFHRVNILSIFINIPIIFLASLMVPACMGALCVYMLTGALPEMAITVTEGLAEIIIRLNSLLSAGGMFSSMVTSAGAGVILLFYLCIFLISSEWCRIRILRKEYRTIASALICAAAISGCFGLASFNQFTDDEVVFVSVGQGDCTHIRAGGKDVLIDGGGSTERNIGEEVLLPYMLSNGAERAELGLVTHLHTDHYRGIAELSQCYPLGPVGIPSDYRRSVDEMNSRNIYSEDESVANGKEGDDKERDNKYDQGQIMLPEEIIFIEPGERINIADGVYIEPIWPLAGSESSIDMDDPNEHNMVYMICYKGTRIMVTGDLLEEDELKMVSYYSGTDTLDCDVLKVAHHGSKSSSSEAFLDAASPEIAVIQVGLHNFYGHPHQQTLDRLEARNIAVYRTDLNGAVGIDILNGRLRIDTVRP